jgi:hypothetical protein
VKLAQLGKQEAVRRREEHKGWKNHMTYSKTSNL